MINGGKWRTSDYFEYLTVPKSGHFVPENYFSPSYSFLYDYINNGQKLECKDETACSTVDIQCAAMNQCNSHGTCNQATGQCECTDGWKFADCSVEVIDMNQATSQTVTTTGPSWASLQYSGSKSS